MSAKKITRGDDFHFTPERIERLSIPAAGKDYYRDARTEGLHLIVRPTGRKTFTWIKKVAGRTRFKNLGEGRRWPDLSIDDARSEAGLLTSKLDAWKADVKKARKAKTAPPPLPEVFVRTSRAPEPAPAKEKTFGELIDSYVDGYLLDNTKAKNPARATRDFRRAFDHHCPDWKSRPCSRITAADVEQLHERIKGTGAKVSANRMAERIRTLYNHFDLTRKINPVRFAKKPGQPGIFKFKEQPRQRFLMKDEMPRFKAALKASGNLDFKHYIAVSLYTAARKGDVLGMRWGDVDLSGKTWTVSTPKTGLPYVVELADLVLAVLKARLKKRKSECPWVFPGTGKTGHIVDFKKRWRALLVAAKLDYPGGERQRPTLHDLRRTLATHALQRGVPMPTISRMLGHKNLLTTARAYAHVQPEAVRQATRETVRALSGMRALPE